MKRAHKASMSQKVEDHIRQAIYTGRLKPRERIIEDDLARELKVSRGTAREALLRLERDGLIVVTNRRGTFIRDIPAEEIPVIYDIRGKLEGLCVRYMRQSLTPPGKLALTKCVNDMKRAASMGDDELFYRADMQLHRTIWRLSGQPQLYRTLELLMNPLMFMIARAYSSRQPIQSRYKDHKDYLDLLLSTPTSRVEREVERYFRRLYRTIFGSGTLLASGAENYVWPSNLRLLPVAR